jgi:zinc D-Ala-D-Ala carboxypeptidase
MANLTQSQATVILRHLGWRVRTTAEFTRCIKNFQAGWYLGPALSVDGSVGAKTSAALLLSESRRRAGKPTASAHFSFSEVACHCGGKYASCWRIWQKRAAFAMMEGYRAKSGRAFKVVSGCRCPSNNAAVGGSKTSRHLSGLASDTQAIYSVPRVKGWAVATHIGYGRLSRKVKHIDMGAGATRAHPLVYVDGA